MNPMTACTRCVDAWQRRDAHTIVVICAPGGAYRDPTTSGSIGSERVHAEWTMTGKNTGSIEAKWS